MSPLRRELVKADLSESIIRQAEQGVYTAAQLELLKKQKQVLRQTIQDTYQAEKALAVAARLEARSKAHSKSEEPVAYLASFMPMGSKLSSTEQGNPQCDIRVCHTCRPHFQERVWDSISRVVGDQVLSLKPFEASRLPVKDPRLLRTIGLRPNPEPSFCDALLSSDENSPLTDDTSVDFSFSSTTPSVPGDSRASTATFKTTQTDPAVVDCRRDPRRRFYALTNRSSSSIARKLASRRLQGMRATLKAIFKPKDREHKMVWSDFPTPPSSSSSAPSSSITLPLPRSGTARNVSEGLVEGEEVKEMDLGPLRRVRRQKERDEFEKGVIRGGFEIGPRLRAHVPVPEKQKSTEEDIGAALRMVESLLGDGEEEERSEVGVPGGVALTEEAVETRTPDVLDVEMEGEADADVDVTRTDGQTVEKGKVVRHENERDGHDGDDVRDQDEIEAELELDEEVRAAWARASSLIAQL